MLQIIEFYSPKKEYGCFSNFSLHPIFVDGKIWRTSEHYYQAQKFAGTGIEELIRQLPNPAEAAYEGRNPKNPLRKDWEEVKNQVMKIALIAKFTQNIDAKKTLLSTDNAILVENSYKDSYWGNGGDGSGKNMLGEILMQVREEIKDFDKLMIRNQK